MNSAGIEGNACGVAPFKEEKASKLYLWQWIQTCNWPSPRIAALHPLPSAGPVASKYTAIETSIPSKRMAW